MYRIYIYIYKREVSVCLSVCLFGFGAQTTGWIPTKFGMGLPLDPVGDLETLFWVDPPRGGIILEKLKNPNFSLMALAGGRNPCAASFAAPFAHFFKKNLDTFLIGRAERGQPTGANCEASRNQLVPYKSIKRFFPISTFSLLYQVTNTPNSCGPGF